MSPTNLVSLGQIEGQAQVLGRLRRLAGNRPPGRVFIFWGPGGAGKRLAARGLAAAWLCLAGPTPEPCGRCGGCLKLAAGTHPDLILLEPEEGKERVSIEQARELIKALRFAPVEGGTRVILLPDAEKLSLEAANALLKTLEEPPADTLTILTADDPDLLPPTVLSRGQLFFFPPRETAWVATQLTKRLNLEPERARLMAALAGDNLETASGQDVEAALGYRSDLLDLFCQPGRVDLSRVFDLVAALAENEDRAQLFLRLAVVVFRDLLLLAGGSAEGLINRDLRLRLANLAQTAPLQTWARKLEAVLTAQAALDSYANLRLTLEALVLKLVPEMGGRQ